MKPTAFISGVAALVAAAAAPALAVEPGVDIAAPRVAISIVDGVSVAYHPARLVVEQGDHVRWNRTGGSHTTTSGASCVADGLWNSGLNVLALQFTREFLEPPAAYPFFCSPHCGLGMTGQVIVTPVIQASAQEVAGVLQLSWSGGLAPYRVYRSDTPAFTTATTIVLTPPAGTSNSALFDQPGTTPGVGKAYFYLVMNQF